MPIALYGCEVWGHSNLQQVEVFYKIYVKYILKLGNSTPTSIIHGETGSTDVATTVHTKMVNFWARLVNGKPGKISSVLLRISQKLHDSTVNPIMSPWLKKIKDTLSTAGLNEMWERAKSGPIPNIDGQIKSKLLEVFKHDWESKLADDMDPELFLYKIVSPTFCNQPASYLSLPVNQAIALAQVRSRNNKAFPVIKHKFDQVLDLNCPLCNSLDPADEIHYLFRCPVFDNLRRELEYVRTATSQGIISGINSMKSLFEDPSIATLRSTAKLIHAAEVALTKHKNKPHSRNRQQHLITRGH